MLEDSDTSARTRKPSINSKNLSPMSSMYSLSPSVIPPSSSRVKDSGIVHTMSHQDCQPLPDDPPKLVATIFYNVVHQHHPTSHIDRAPTPQNIDSLPPPSVAPGSAPVSDLSKYPLEPPTADPIPLDHLYGSHVSQLCLTSFLGVLDSLPPSLPYRPLQSSHRCLADISATPRVMEVTFSPPPNPEYLPFPLLRNHESLSRFEQSWNVEVILQRSTAARRYPRLAVFDMDSTLIEQEVIDVLASYLGPQVEAAISSITARAMAGELDFAASLRERVALLKGLPSTIFDTLLHESRITITPGAYRLCRILRAMGCRTAVLSGGFQPLANWLARQLNLDHAIANHLLTDPTTNTLTGTLDPSHPIVTAEYKRETLRSLAKQYKTPMSQTIAVGDGANDIPMLKAAGLGVAWRAKERVQMEAPARLNVARDLADLVYLCGLTKAEADELVGLAEAGAVEAADGKRLEGKEKKGEKEAG